jgi:hypothetical protein
MLLLLQFYFWFMVLYLAASVVTKLLKAREFAAMGNNAAFWAEEVAGYVLLSIGLLGVYGYMTSTPYLSPTFWRAFAVILIAFSAFQFFMPKMKLLRREKGSRVVIVAVVVGVLMLLPMFVAIGYYISTGFAANEA